MAGKSIQNLHKLSRSIPLGYPAHRAISRAEAQRLDAQASEIHGIPSLVLMEHASRGIAEVVSMLARPRDPVLVLCGPGNNGGDGYGAARFLRSWGWRPRVLCLAKEPPPSGDALTEFLLCNEQASVEHVHDRPERVAELISVSPTLIVDALFGVGLRDRELTSPWIDWIDAINACETTVVSVDIPSGMLADTGHEVPRCIHADVTATMAAPKRGFSANPNAVGRVIEIDIGLPRTLHEPLAVQSDDQVT